MSDVIAIDSVVHLGRTVSETSGEVWVATHVIDQIADGMTPNSTHRISHLLGLAVVSSDGTRIGVVKDVRLAPNRSASGRDRADRLWPGRG